MIQASLNAAVPEGTPGRRRVQARGLVLKRGDHQVQPAIPVEVAPVHAHAALVLAGRRKGYPSHEAVVAKVPASLVDIQVARHLVVGEVEVRPAVAVHIGKGGSQALPVRSGQAVGACHILKAAVPQVPVETSDLRIVEDRSARGLDAAVVTELQRVLVKDDVARDVQVDQAVSIHVRKCRAGSPGCGRGRLQAGS